LGERIFEHQYLRTERAHFMCPNMFFGILFDLKKDYLETEIQNTLNRLCEAHPFLRSVISYEDGSNNLYYKDTGVSQIQIFVRNGDFSWIDYETVSLNEWNVFNDGLLKVYFYRKESGTAVLFVVHHLLADGKGALSLAEEFANDYVGGIYPEYAPEYLITSISELPPKSELGGISKLLIDYANRHWKKENKRLNYEEYSNFVKEYGKTHKVTHERKELSPEEFGSMKEICKQDGVTVNDVLLAQMFIDTGCNKIIIAVDIREHLTEYIKGSLGNYSTAFSVMSKSKTTDLRLKAVEVHKIVRNHIGKAKDLMLVLACYFCMDSTLLDAAAMAGLGYFDSKSAAFVGGKMFGYECPSSNSITNLGRITNTNIDSAMFIPPASPATKKTLGVVTVNDKMSICSSQYDRNSKNFN